MNITIKLNHILPPIIPYSAQGTAILWTGYIVILEGIWKYFFH